MRALCLLGLLVATPALGAPEHDERLRLLLRAHHELPDASVFEAAHPQAAETLMRWAESGPGAVRPKAMQALLGWRTPAVKAFFLRQAKEPRTPELLRQRAILLVARGFGTEVVADLEPFLRAPSAGLQEAAVVALGGITDPRARQVLVRAQLSGRAQELRAQALAR